MLQSAGKKLLKDAMKLKREENEEKARLDSGFIGDNNNRKILASHALELNGVIQLLEVLVLFKFIFGSHIYSKWIHYLMATPLITVSIHFLAGRLLHHYFTQCLIHVALLLIFSNNSISRTPESFTVFGLHAITDLFEWGFILF